MIDGENLECAILNYDLLNCDYDVSNSGGLMALIVTLISMFSVPTLSSFPFEFVTWHELTVISKNYVLL